MPYLKALIISELQNDVEIHQFVNTDDLRIPQDEKPELFMIGLRGGMNDLFNDFKK